MKFSQTLGTHLTPEWREQYIAYVKLKETIMQALQNAPTVARHRSLTRLYFSNFEEQFFMDLDKELQKVNVFFAQKLAEAMRRYNGLVDTMSTIYPQSRPSRLNFSNVNSNRSHENVHLKSVKVKHLKLAFSELYLSLILLQNYQVLNHTGFRKICKKYDKLMVSDSGHKWFIKNADKASFVTNKELNTLIKDVEHYFTIYLEKGDRSRAMKRLRVPPLAEVQNSFTLFRLGLFTGALIVLLALLAIACIRNVLQSAILTYDLFLFRGPLLVIIHVLLVSINIYDWRRWGVNHILIFEINPRNHITYSQLSELASFLAVIWTLCVLGFIYGKYLHISRFIFPLVLVIIMLCVLVFPIPIANCSSRLWFLKVLVLISHLLNAIGRLISAPLFPVQFADFWLGDQLNSLTTSLIDSKNIICFYMKNPNWKEDFHYDKCLQSTSILNGFVLCLPAWFRFAQCMRQFHDNRQLHPYLTNAGKYATIFVVVTFNILKDIHKDKYSVTTANPFVWCLLCSQLISTIYGCLWDVLGDFGLFKISRGENKFLRENIIYSKGFYYFAIVENILLRFSWFLGFYLVTRQYIQGEYMQSILAFSEIVRRYIWNYLRLENEHLYNVGQFRAVRDIFIAPLASDEANVLNLETIVDEQDVPMNHNTV